MDNNRLKIYEIEVRYLEALDSSPFEALDVLHIRDRLMDDYSSLSPEEIQLLKECDQTLLKHVDKFYLHIGEVYNWKSSQEPYVQWWWHLDKINMGKLNVNLHSNQIEYKEEYTFDVMYSGKDTPCCDKKDYAKCQIANNLQQSYFPLSMNYLADSINLYEIIFSDLKERVA